jgi:hypothetical protein
VHSSDTPLLTIVNRENRARMAPAGHKYLHQNLVLIVPAANIPIKKRSTKKMVAYLGEEISVYKSP